MSTPQPTTSYTNEQLGQIRGAVNNNDPERYYTLLSQFNNGGYANAALNIARDTGFEGGIVNYILSYGEPEEGFEARRIALSTELMKADFSARQEHGKDVTTAIINAYHIEVFNDPTRNQDFDQLDWAGNYFEDFWCIAHCNANEHIGTTQDIKEIIIDVDEYAGEFIIDVKERVGRVIQYFEDIILPKIEEGVPLGEVTDHSKFLVSLMSGIEGAEEVTTHISSRMADAYIKEIDDICGDLCQDIEILRSTIPQLRDKRNDSVRNYNALVGDISNPNYRWDNDDIVARFLSTNDSIIEVNSLLDDVTALSNRITTKMANTDTRLSDLSTKDWNSYITTVSSTLSPEQGAIFDIAGISVIDHARETQLGLNTDISRIQTSLTFLDSAISSDNLSFGRSNRALPSKGLGTADTLFNSFGDVSRISTRSNVLSPPSTSPTTGDTDLDITIWDLIINGQDGFGNSLNSIFSPNDNFINIGTNFSGGQRELESKTDEERRLGVLGGYLINGGNYSVHSVVANVPGGWTVPVGGISEGYQPGRGNLGVDGSEYVSGLTDPLAIAGHIGWSGRQKEIDPLVLDLDGDGIELKPFAGNQIFFDVDNDGNMERTGWVGEDDGILVHDRNGNGRIDDITETISEYYGAAKGTGAIYTDGFDALRTLDSNADGVINNEDSAFANLRVWQDANGNAETDEGELKTLESLGITEFKLNDVSDGAFIGGNEVRSRAKYVKNDLEFDLASVNFIADPSGAHESVDGTGKKYTLEDSGIIYSAGDDGETFSLVTKNQTIASNEPKYTSAIGGSGNDTLTGDNEDNWLIGGLGADTLSGGGGNDYIIADADDIKDGQSAIRGGAGYDIVQFVGNRGVAFNLQQAGVEMVIGSDRADTLVSGSTESSIIEGGGGNDVILGGSADDVLNGEEGNDFINGYNGDDLIRGHRGEDTLTGGRGEDIIQGGLGDDSIYGGAQQDLLDGGAGNDLLDGGADYDVAEYSSSYGDYLVTANADGSYTVRDRRTNSPDGTDTLRNIEALNFKDIKEVSLAQGNPLPVKDRVRLTESGQTFYINKSRLLANDLDYQGDSLSITSVFDPIGGTVRLEGSRVKFVLDEGFMGIPSFSYKIKDEHNNNGSEVIQRGTDNFAEMTAQVTLQLPHHPNDPQFLDQWYLSEINVLPVWQNYTGEGIDVGVFEPGPWDGEEYGQIDYSHPDLDDNIDAEAKRTYNPNIEPTKHATLVAGVIAAERNNSGSVGVAYDATLTSEGVKVNNPDDPNQNNDFRALSNWDDYDVVNNSWGRKNLFSLDKVLRLTRNSLTQTLTQTSIANLFSDAVENGRGGLGTAIVFGAGNERKQGHNTNASQFTNDRRAIVVGAINAEGDLGNLVIGREPFSNPGASILVSAPGSNITSTSRLVENSNGSTFGDDYEETQGTSFATPIVSGVVALMLEANRDLGWRDIQEILALSAKKVDDSNTTWGTNGANNWNGGGMHFSHDYGFGLVDAHAAVRLAETWQKQNKSSNEEPITEQSRTLDRVLQDGSGSYSNTIRVTRDIKVENVEVVLNLQHDQMGDLEVVLVSPNRSESKLIWRPGKAPESNDRDRGYGVFTGIWKIANVGIIAENGTQQVGTSIYTGDGTWQVATNNHWGEGSAGDWRLVVRDKVTGETGTLRDWQLKIYGENEGQNNTYIYTNEFASIGTGAGARLRDSGGHDIINTSAVTGDVVLNIRGSTSIINGHTFAIDGNIIEDVYTGDGDDAVYANRLGNTIKTGRGDDRIYAYAAESGNDVIDGGEGNDSIYYQRSFDNYDITYANGSFTIREGSSSSYDTVRNVENFYFNNVNLMMAGNSSNNRLTASSGQRVFGLGGSDTYILNVRGLQVPAEIQEGVNEGNDKVEIRALGTAPTTQYTVPAHYGFKGELISPERVGTRTANLSYTLPDNVEDLVLDGWYTTGIGNRLNNHITGTSNNDTLNGRGGADTLVGGRGNDIYYIDNVGDVVVEPDNAGTDTIHSSISYTLRPDSNIENLTLIGSSNIRGRGNHLNNVIVGNSHNNILDGRGGADRLAGGDGNDTYYVDNAGDAVWENDNAGTDKVYSSVNYTLGSNIENLTLTGSSNINGTGNNLNNTIYGNSGNNRLDGGGGADRLYGGDGNDTYYVDNVGDSVREYYNGGIDEVHSSINYTLDSNVENLTLIGSSDINGTGNNRNNVITGNSGNNILNGRGGANRLIGGLGDDVYHVDSVTGDVVVERANQGTDKIISSVNYDLIQDVEGDGTVENLSLIGNTFSRLNGRGTDGDNTLAGHEGSNFLDGRQGDDTLRGLGGRDDLHGNRGDDQLHGGSGADSLSGGADNDQLFGGTGSDAYYFEALTGGHDTITEEAETGVINKVYIKGINNENRLRFGRGGSWLTPNDLIITILDRANGSPTSNILTIKDFWSAGTTNLSEIGNSFRFYFQNGASRRQFTPTTNISPPLLLTLTLTWAAANAR